jgi:hypothetical protein
MGKAWLLIAPSLGLPEKIEIVKHLKILFISAVSE